MGAIYNWVVPAIKNLIVYHNKFIWYIIIIILIEWDILGKGMDFRNEF